MSDMLQVVLIIFGTVLVTLVAILTGVAVSTLVEVRATARRVREVLDRVAPSAEKTLENVEHVTEALARTTSGIRHLGNLFGSGKGGSGRIAPWASLLAGAAGTWTALRRLRSSREGRRRKGGNDE